jgi:type I restriction enzyme M protein
MKRKTKKTVKQKTKAIAKGKAKVKSKSAMQTPAKVKAVSSVKQAKSKPLTKFKVNGHDSDVAKTEKRIKVEKIKKPKKQKVEVEKSLEAWLWDAACAIRGAQEAPKFKDYILPLVFVKRLCDVFDDEVNRLATEFGSKKVVLKLLEKDRKLVRFYLPFRPADIETQSTWEVIKLMTATSTKSLGQQLTDLMHAIARENSKLNRIVNRIDYNNTTHGVREIADDRLEILINRLSTKKLGLTDVEPDIIGRSYEYLIRKFAEGAGQSAGEFYSPTEAGLVMARILDPEPGMTCYDPTIGSAGLVIKLQLALLEKVRAKGLKKYEPLKMYGQEYLPLTWAMANMNMVIHEMEGEIKIGDTMKNPDLLTTDKKGLMQFDRITANPMWNQDVFTAKDYEKDEYNRFGNRIPPAGSADWGWMQHIFASLKPNGRAAVILDTGAASRGSGGDGKSAEKEIRKWFVDNDLIEGVIYLPENLFYNTTAPGIVVFLSKNKPVHLRDKIILVNATRCFEKGNPKNFIDETCQGLIVDAYKHFFINPRVESVAQEMPDRKGGMALVTKDQLIKNDYNISPTKYISIGTKEVLLPVRQLIQQLSSIMQDADKKDDELRAVLTKLGY